MNNLTCHNSNNEYQIIQDILFQNNNSDLTPPDWFNQYQENEPTADPYAPDFSFLGGQTAEQFLSISREMAEFGQLGIITKSASTFAPFYAYRALEPSDFQAEKMVNFFEKNPLNDSEKRRSIRYKLLQISQHILPNTHRVNSCLRYRINKDDDIKILKHADHNCNHYGNLIRCGSVWLCPVCSAKISEIRRLELQQAKENWLGDGGYVYMLTLTTPHYHDTDLEQLLDGQAKALKLFWGGREAEQIRADLGMIGHIRAFEITNGQNGFHPHYHILLFTRVNLDDDKIYKKFGKRFSKRWQNSCVQAGLKKPTLKHGCQLQNGSCAFEYINKFADDGFEYPEFDGFISHSASKDPSKIKVKMPENGRWNSSHELTKAHSKKGNKESLTPFDFLRNYNENPAKYGKLFKIYADATKGKAQLFWSHGLKKLLGVGETTDQQAAENPNISEIQGENNDLAIINQTDQKSVLVATVKADAWVYVRNHRLQHELLIISHKGKQAVDDFICELLAYELEKLEQKLKESPPPRPKKKPPQRRFN